MTRFRQALSLQVLPMWLGVPIGTLGVAFVVMKPFGLGFDWATYAFCLLFAATGGILARRNYHVTVVARELDSVTYRLAKRARG